MLLTIRHDFTSWFCKAEKNRIVKSTIEIKFTWLSIFFKQSWFVRMWVFNVCCWMWAGSSFDREPCKHRVACSSQPGTRWVNFSRTQYIFLDRFYVVIVLCDSLCVCLGNSVSEVIPNEGKSKVVSREVMDRCIDLLSYFYYMRSGYMVWFNVLSVIVSPQTLLQ